MSTKKVKVRIVEKTQKEMDDVFPGFENLRKISKGILENEDESQAADQNRICINKESFDLLMRKIADSYEKYNDELIIEDAEKIDREKVKALCNRFGYKTFKEFLTLINAWELAQKGGLFKDTK